MSLPNTNFNVRAYVRAHGSSQYIRLEFELCHFHEAQIRSMRCMTHSFISIAINSNEPVPSTVHWGGGGISLHETQALSFQASVNTVKFLTFPNGINR